MHGKIRTIIFLHTFLGKGFLGKKFLGNAYPSQQNVNKYVAERIKWCRQADSRARVCADQLVNDLTHRFSESFGCMVSKPGYESGTGYYWHMDDDQRYNVWCFPFPSTFMDRR